MKNKFPIRQMALMTAAFALSGALIFAQRSSAAPKKSILREDIEWCDIWLPHSNSTDLPHVLLIGDSIVRGYGNEVEKQLAGRAYVGRLATSYSIGDPALLLQIKAVLADRHFDVIQFNNGLHGWGYTEAAYKKHFPALVAEIRTNAPNAKLIWATTTPMRNSAKLDEFDSLNERVKARNVIAAAHLAHLKIPTTDLFSLVEAHPEYSAPDGVHYNEDGAKVQAKQVTDAIASLLVAAK